MKLIIEAKDETALHDIITQLRFACVVWGGTFIAIDDKGEEVPLKSYIPRLTDKELKEILDDMEQMKSEAKKELDYSAHRFEAFTRKENRKGVFTIGELLAALNSVDNSTTDDLYYKIKAERLIKKLFKFAKEEGQ
jgi:hypothetical protein